MKKNITFRYDAMQENWVEYTCPEWQTANAENLPVLFVTRIHDERSGEESVQAWCETHRAYEKIDRCTDDGLATERGCRLKGIPVYADTSVDPFRYIYTELTNETTLRWQVRHCPEKGTVEISQDNILFSFDWIRKEKGDFVLVPFLHSARHMKIKLSLRGTIPRRGLFPMPVAVAAAALAALREEAAKLYGFVPPVLLPTRPDAMGIGYLGGGKHGWGEDASPWLLAFLHRPLDMRIQFFQDYFKKEKFEELFPRTQTNNFSVLCRILGVTPNDEAKADYENRGMDFLMRPMLRHLLPKLGVRQEALQEKFMGLSDFCGKKGMEAYGQYLLHPSLRPDDAEEKPADLWEDLRFYCDWRQQSEPEEALTAHLLAMQGTWRPYKEVLLQRFRRYFADIPQTVKDKLFRQGPTADIYDEIAIIVRDIESRTPDRSISEEERSLECRIGGYNFRLLTSLAVRKRIFFGTHVYPAAEFDDGTTAMIGVEKNGVYLGIISVEDKVANSRLLPYWFCPDEISLAKIRIAYLRWMLHNGLSEAYSGNDDCRRALVQELPVEPLDRDWEDVGLWEMLNLPDAAIRPGYYLELFRKIMETRTLRLDPPSAKYDERTYLTHQLPWGKRFFDAAWAGNPEAQYVMSLFYHRYSYRFSCYDAQRAADWYKKACDNGWLEIETSKPAIKLEGFCGQEFFE